MSTLKSGINKKFIREFVLNEEGLRRIVGVFETKARELPFPTAIVFHVKREDDRFYETELIEDVLSDPNTDERKISQLGIEIRNTDPSKKPEPWERDWIAAVQFSLDSNEVVIAVASEDKNWALLLTDELEPQITRTQTTKKIATWLLLLFYFSIGAFLIASIKKYTSIMPESFPTTLKTAVYFIIIILSIFTWGSRPKFINKWVGPNSFFDWGNQSNVHSEQNGLRQNIQWVVIAGFIISIVASVYTSNVLSV